MLQQRLLWCTLTSNSAESSGGIYTDSSTLSFTGTSNFTNNSANKGGGTIYALQHVSTFSGTKVVQSAQIISPLKLICQTEIDCSVAELELCTWMGRGTVTAEASWVQITKWGGLVACSIRIIQLNNQFYRMGILADFISFHLPENEKSYSSSTFPLFWRKPKGIKNMDRFFLFSKKA